MSINCVGEMYKEQNIMVRCADEADDFEYYDGFDTWEEAIKYFKETCDDLEIVELETM